MRTRSISAIAAAAALALTACGGGDGGGSALSEDDFVDAVGDICDDTRADLERIDFPTDDDFSAFAEDSIDVLNTALADLGEITPPENVARDFEDFVAVLEDEVKALEKIGEANGSDEVDQGFERLLKLSDEQSEAAQDIDVEACDPNADGGADTTVAETTPATTVPATTAAPVTTAAPITLPSTVPPTAPPATATPPTDAPAGTTFEVVDLTTQFVAPDGFYLTPKTPDQGTLDLIASLPELNEKLLSIGVATLVESGSDLEIADVWLGVSITDSMPADWKTLDCPTGDLRTSGNGILGIVCTAAIDSPFWEIFTATDADVGISVYTRVPDITGDLVADAFLEANF